MLTDLSYVLQKEGIAKTIIHSLRNYCNFHSLTGIKDHSLSISVISTNLIYEGFCYDKIFKQIPPRLLCRSIPFRADGRKIQTSELFRIHCCESHPDYIPGDKPTKYRSGKSPDNPMGFSRALTTLNHLTQGVAKAMSFGLETQSELRAWAAFIKADLSTRPCRAE